MLLAVGAGGVTLGASKHGRVANKPMRLRMEHLDAKIEAHRQDWLDRQVRNTESGCKVEKGHVCVLCGDCGWWADGRSSEAAKVEQRGLLLPLFSLKSEVTRTCAVLTAGRRRARR
jgi:hypothetical protein